MKARPLCTSLAWTEPGDSLATAGTQAILQSSPQERHRRHQLARATSPSATVQPEVAVPVRPRLK